MREKEKKWKFLGVYSSFHGQRSVTATWAIRSPWSIQNQATFGMLFCLFFRLTNFSPFCPIDLHLVEQHKLTDPCVDMHQIAPDTT